MIYTVTFNPALDVSGSVEEVIPNEKSYVQDEIYTPGGNGINAGIISSRLGSKVTLTGFLGGSNGEEIKILLSREKALRSFVAIKGRTRMNLTVSNRTDHQQTRLSFPGPRIMQGEAGQLMKLLQVLKSGDVLLLGGSLPPGLSVTYVRKLVKSARDKNVICLVDMPGELLKGIVSAGPYFIKPNLVEFQELTGKKVTNIKSVIKEAQKLMNKIPLICVSSVEGGALLISENETWFGKIPEVKIFSSVGAGDSMVGAIAHRMNKESEFRPEMLLRMGLAASCATLTEKGLTLGTRKNILKYYPKVFMKKIS